jgi:hypothetical protein
MSASLGDRAVVRPAAALLVALSLLGVSSCGPSASSSSRSPGPTTESSVGADAGTLTGTINAGEATGSATVDPFEAAVVEATGPDGSTYRLDIEAASVRHPTVVSLRPLSSISFSGATLLAGVEIEPSGLQLFVPAVLTIIPAIGAGATVPTAMEYAGSSQVATARIAAVTTTSSALAYQLVLTHFSGGIITSLTPETETSLFEAFSSAHAMPNTPEGRQAQAETGLRTIKWAEDHDRIDHETATRRTADYERQWWEAEADRVRDDPVLRDEIKSGKPADADAVSAEVARILEAAKRANGTDAETNAAVIEATGLAAEYGLNLVKNLQSDPGFQATLKSGLVSDQATIIDMMGVIAGLAHQAALMGHDDVAKLMIQAWNDFFATMGTALGASCSQAPIGAALALGLTRQAALIGQEATVAALQDCLPTPPPCPGALLPGMAITLAAFAGDLGSGGQSGGACGPAPSGLRPTKLVGSADLVISRGSASNGDGDYTGTMHAINVVWQEDQTGGADSGLYHVTSGTMNWSVSGHEPASGGDPLGCAYGGAGSESLVVDEPEGHWPDAGDPRYRPNEDGYLGISVDPDFGVTYVGVSTIGVHGHVTGCSGSDDDSASPLGLWLSIPANQPVLFSGGVWVLQGNYVVTGENGGTKGAQYSWKFTSAP